MEASPSAMLKILLPKTPFILKTALAHTLSLSETSSKWDLRTELYIKVMRSMLGPDTKPTPISKAQRLTTKDPGIKGKMWISKFSSPVDATDEDVQDVRRLVLEAVDAMCTTDEQRNSYDKPPSRPLEAEWTGYRAKASDSDPEPPNLTEKDKYNKLVGETTTKVTTLYFHGGAMYLLDPVTYRNLTSRIAKETGGRVFSVRYRLAPQNPFPAALLDAFTAYLCLLYPPPGSQHDAIPAEQIIFGGDSAGGMLCTALLQLLLQIRRSSSSSPPTVTWYGKTVPIPLPGGLALISPWLDVTRSLPSIESLAKYDYLPPPSHAQHTRFPPCSAWPTNPPRADLYCEGAMLLHPLVSPLMARDWRGSPPVFFSLGEEMLRDEDAVLARRLDSQGVKVVWREFEAMPHVFAVMLDGTPVAEKHHEEFGAFCKGVLAVGGGGGGSDGVVFKAKKLKTENVLVKDVTRLTDEEVDELCRKGMEDIIKKPGDAAAEARPML
ncbi:acetyl-hydrolase [Periconia macrospinosa]|uniref:Acetyl-hydrolase n=1 Tax=Periconia macrospinosa TaxID=97972 RepID=A0A2V1E7R0_9PLEO|nr:acetyl-hydrolase [Periconia macrospinosa]